MKAVILAGGFGSRLSEETQLKPKPMVQIGRMPILWHIMKYYSTFGVNDFLICLGYKGYVIKEYFANYFLHMSDLTIDMQTNEMHIHKNECEPWKVSLIDTGLNTLTGGRLKRVKEYIKDEEIFLFTYGDGLSDVNIDQLVSFHKSHGKKATLTAVKPPGRYGALALEDSNVRKFQEKPEGDGNWINGGFFVLSPDVIDYIAGDQISFEKEPLENLAADNQLMAFKHDGFWYAMDTLRDKQELLKLWDNGKAPWKKWN